MVLDVGICSCKSKAKKNKNIIQGIYALQITAECRMNPSMNVNSFDILVKTRIFYEIFLK